MSRKESGGGEIVGYIGLSLPYKSLQISNALKIIHLKDN